MLLTVNSQPQRPRALRVRDENQPPINVAPNKTIHQRNKSTPALSSLLNVGANKGNIKRTAFADVSNTAGLRHGQQSSKDDLILPAKAAHNAFPARSALAPLKENININSTLPPVSELVKPSAFLRPAQRPHAPVAHKSSATSATTDVVANVLPKQDQTTKISEDIKPARVLSKKQTTIFKEVLPAASDEVEPSAAVLQVRQDPSIAHLLQTTTEKRDALADTLKDLVATQEPLLKPDELPLDPLLKDPMPHAVEPATQCHAELIPLNLPDESYSVQQLELPASILPDNLETLLGLSQPIPELAEVNEVKSARQSLILPSGEAEEYWEEDEEEEYYDADGYTTARSIRSRADTTGGVTIVMEPRVTAKVERELAAAKQFVEATKTAEDIEDEAWDTSMVAEYGDEIFSYMRDLEVGSHKI